MAIRESLVVLNFCALSFAGGCSLLLDFPEESIGGAGGQSGEGGAGGVGGSADPIWGCLGNVTERTPNPSDTVEVAIQLVFASGGEPLTTATVDFCDKLDIACAGSEPGLPKGITPDENGHINVDLAEGFDGFVRIADAEIVDSRLYFGRPIVEPKANLVQLLRPAEYEALASIALTSIDPTHGTVILHGVDCKGDSAAGLRFETPSADAGTSQFYLINQAPTVPPTATETDADGIGGFFNLPAGAATASSHRVLGEVYVGESSFQVLANTISYVEILPTPT